MTVVAVVRPSGVIRRTGIALSGAAPSFAEGDPAARARQRTLLPQPGQRPMRVGDRRIRHRGGHPHRPHRGEQGVVHHDGPAVLQVAVRELGGEQAVAEGRDEVPVERVRCRVPRPGMGEAGVEEVDAALAEDIGQFPRVEARRVSDHHRVVARHHGDPLVPAAARGEDGQELRQRGAAAGEVDDVGLHLAHVRQCGAEVGRAGP
ncbi:hypothetical protein ABZ250_38590 [Streptomyces afghaniensis]|uniref:hypothetical protein n=1 Tax=Streptomyces afghaniensis TaxID=66865 RepID=UPI0033B8F8B6